jgi:uncharacterized membrane protein YbaN (DUF454 family)
VIPDERDIEQRVEGPTGPPRATGFKRWFLIAIGVVSTLLATIGAFLPVLPTTPFLLLAIACFTRSAPRFHQMLLASPIFGRYLTQWQERRTVPPEAKWKAYGLTVVSFGLSIYFVNSMWLRVGLIVGGILLLAFLASLPTGEKDA